MEHAAGENQGDSVRVEARMDILIQLYEGAINFFRRAVTALTQGQQTEFDQQLQRGRAIILEFQRTLDFTQGGEVAAQLNQLYDFMLDNLKNAQEQADPKPVEHVILLLNNLLDGWRKVHPNHS